MVYRNCNGDMSTKVMNTKDIPYYTKKKEPKRYIRKDVKSDTKREIAMYTLSLSMA